MANIASSKVKSGDCLVPLLEDEFLSKTNDVIAKLLSGPEFDGNKGTSLTAISAHLCLSAHAKRARPLLCLYFHWLFNDNVSYDFIKIAVAAEFIHAASLLHDDVVDEAIMRRGKVSANALYGNAQAVLAGDFLLTEAFDLLRPFERELMEQAIIVVKEMTTAALVEINARGKIDFSEASWKVMARGKTGVLFSWCGFAASIFANSHADKERMWAMGEHIGHLFQMADDLKDFSGDQNLKDVCRDIRNKEPSLPVILAAHSDSLIMKQFRECFAQDFIQDSDVEHLHTLVVNSGAIDEIKTRMNQLEMQVRSMIAPYEGSIGKARLEEWVSELLTCEINATIGPKGWDVHASQCR